MPNWCEGTLKIRGSYERVKKFFEEGLAVHHLASFNKETGEWIDRLVDKKEWFEKTEEYDGTYYTFSHYEPHVEGTNRAFIIDGENFVPNKGITIVKFEQAWDVRTEDWIALSKKYDLDFRIYTFECGGQFCREVEVIKGELTIDKTIKYDDWYWECPMPDMGG